MCVSTAGLKSTKCSSSKGVNVLGQDRMGGDYYRSRVVTFGRAEIYRQ
jgi:hypothetical protein